MREIEFEKYKDMGAYHWSEASGNIVVMNSFVLARYQIVVNVLKELDLNENSRILIVGCGDGALSGFIYREFKSRIYGVDTNKIAIDLARSKFSEMNYRGEFSLSDGYKYDYNEKFFDVVLCADVIEHVNRPIDMLKEMKRLLRPGGCLIISTPIRLKETPKNRYHVQEWFENDFRAMLAEVFLEKAELTISHPGMWFEIYRNGYVKGGIWKISWIVMNLFAKIGMNVFLNNNSWSIYMMQTWVLKRAEENI